MTAARWTRAAAADQRLLTSEPTAGFATAAETIHALATSAVVRKSAHVVSAKLAIGSLRSPTSGR